MYLLEFLEKASNQTNKPGGDTVGVEYRLACSGELYNRRVINFLDWAEERDATRLGCSKRLWNCSWPASRSPAYPQELCARLTLGYVTEKKADQSASSTSIFLPR